MTGMSRMTKWEVIVYAASIAVFYVIGMIMGFQFEWGNPADVSGAIFMTFCVGVIGYCYINLCLVHYKIDYDNYRREKRNERRRL